ncbi:hypothetical protein SCLCIDRAFT_415227 [Scleroderma citrinum Foug A]|uniref:Uncharacterized protein n=1 Tax=Scleroderma citrinum Foug A TaxID=1036808 RepID=A0A0C3ECV4_9AGAM|nr:hypothetical protein SCLCIDRAFT_415227 [Scleroderma citrinum Foug A]
MVLYIVAYLGRTSTWMHDAAYSTIGSKAVLAARSYLFDNLKTVLLRCRFGGHESSTAIRHRARQSSTAILCWRVGQVYHRCQPSTAFFHFPIVISELKASI